PKRSSSGTVFSQSRHQPCPGVRMISSRAPSANVPRVAASKQNSIALGSTQLKVPISSHTVLTREKPCLRASSRKISTTPSVSDISCMGFVQNFHLDHDAGIEDESQSHLPLGAHPRSGLDSKPR